MRLFKVDSRNGTVREVEGMPHPGSDSEGDKVFWNTHFEKADDAWGKLRAEIESRVKLKAIQVNEAEIALRKAIENASGTNTLMARYVENRDAYLRAKGEQ